MKTLKKYLVRKIFFSSCLAGAFFLGVGVNANPREGGAREGTSVGNGADLEIPYKGFKKNQPIRNYPVTMQENLLENPAKVSFKLEKVFVSGLDYLKAIPANYLVNGYLLPTDSGDLQSLYEAAVHKQGNFKSITNPANPFSKYRVLPEGKDLKAAFKDLLAKEETSLFSIDDSHLFSEAFLVNFQFKANTTLIDESEQCSFCRDEDYKKIPSGGIAVKVACLIPSKSSHIMDADEILAGKNRKEGMEIYDASEEFIIHSRRDVISKTVNILTPQAAEQIRLKFCENPKEVARTFYLHCGLVGARPADQKKLEDIFRHTYKFNFEVGLQVANLKHPFFLGHMFTSPEAYLEIGDAFGEDWFYEKNIFGNLSLQQKGYSFPDNYGQVIYYRNAEADLSEFLRLTYINLYKKQFIDTQED